MVSGLEVVKETIYHKKKNLNGHKSLWFVWEVADKLLCSLSIFWLLSLSLLILNHDYHISWNITFPGTHREASI